MFSFFTSKTKSAASAHPSQHARGASQAQNDLPTWRTSVQQNGSTQEGGYDDVSLSVHSQVDLSRPSFSAPSPTSGDFINSFNESSSYPPTSSSHLPPMTGYPPLRTTFYRLQSLLASRSPALLDSLSPAVPSYSPALASLLHTIRPYTLPLAVLDAYACHDGQDPFSTNGGLLWGLRWMPLDEVETEYLFWRKLEGAGGEGGMWDAFSASTGVEPSGGEGSGREHPYQGEGGEEERGGGMEGMRSFPPGWVRSRYSHPGWIPLASDGMGNYLGVDLDPPPPPSAADGNAAASGSETRRYGAAGQVIAFGREMDEKVVLFPGDSNGGWGRFLSSFVDDVERGNFARLEVGDGSGSEEEGADGDGIGERSYLEGDRYGEEDDISGCWTLRNEYKRWMAEDSERSLISAIAERSKRQWQHLGVGLPPASSSRPPLKLVLPAKPTGTHEDDEALESSTTARPPSPNLLISSARPSLEVEAGAPTMSLILSPPSPQPESASLPSPPPTLLVLSPPAPSSSSSSKNTNLHPVRKGRRPPPPPMPIALPIFGDLESDTPSFTTLPQFSNGTGSPHSGNVGTPTRERLLDSAFSGSPAGSLRGELGQGPMGESRVALVAGVEGDIGGRELSLEGLGIRE